MFFDFDDQTLKCFGFDILEGHLHNQIKLKGVAGFKDFIGFQNATVLIKAK